MRTKTKLNLFFSSASLFLLLLNFALPANVSANVGVPSHGGTAGAEPAGLKQIFILGETLKIDLRPLAADASEGGGRILVEAVYEVENKGADQKLDLIFAFGSAFEDFQVRLDDREITSNAVELQNEPQSWKIPSNTPWLNGAQLEYAPGFKNSSGAQGFSLVMPAGKHRLKARYKAAPTQYSSNPVKLWQFAYILAPARQWAGFGGLDVTIFAPKDWTVVSAPNLQRDGETLTGRFNEIPADALTLTAQSPIPFSYKLADIFLNVLFFSAIFLIPVALGIFAWKRGYQFKLAWLLGIGLALLWSVLILLTGFLAATGANYAIPKSQFSSYGYVGLLHIFGALLAGIAAFPIGITLWLTVIYLARRKKTAAGLK